MSKWKLYGQMELGYWNRKLFASLILLVFWNLWKARNTFVFYGKKLTTNKIIRLALLDFNDVLSYSVHQEYNAPFSTQLTPSWKHPWHKINMDGSYNGRWDQLSFARFKWGSNPIAVATFLYISSTLNTDLTINTTLQYIHYMGTYSN